MTQNVRLQNLRDFTVQIRDANDKIVGTGIAVSTDGKIVTCAHVVEATGIDPRNANGAEVGVYFPQLHGGEEKKYKAIVEKYFLKHDDDVVLLTLKDGTSPLAPEQIAQLGTAEFSEGNPFRTYGYSPIGNYPATRGDGIIQGSVEAPVDRKLQVDPIQLKSRDIAAGMSGAAVLDVTRNLVVGLVMERFYSTHAVQDDIGYGVDSKVLTFDPFDFVLRGEALELKPAPELRLDKDLFQQAIEIVNYVRAYRKPDDRFSWNSAPTVLPEWTGRDDLLAQITEDWNNPAKHVTGLIGFGGEGKSSLARKWVETLEQPALNLSKGSNVSTFDGLFWWGFYENRSIDEFLEAALNFLSGGRIDPRQVPSSSLRAQIIGAMLGAGRYLFVLDGLEVLQHQEGDQYGLLTSNDLRDLLTYFARPDNQSFCLITSRAPVLDLMDYTTYTHRDVERLSEADGVALLEKLGVKGSKVQKENVVLAWNGHALTLSLIGSYLVKVHKGDVTHVTDFDFEESDEVQSSAPDQYKHVGRILRRYDEHLTEAERAFMILFSAFRTPVRVTAFDKVFRSSTQATELNKPLLTLSDREFKEMLKRLETYRMLRRDPLDKSYTTHPLIRNHYFALLTRGNVTLDTVKTSHNQIKDYYLSLAGDTPQYPTLDDLKPLIEVVHHACQAGAYDEAFSIFWDKIFQTTKRVLLHQLGAYETDLSVMFEFLPDDDTTKDPQTSKSDYNRFILNEIGLCLMNLGRLREAVPFYERVAKSALDEQNWEHATAVYQNLADLHAQLGALEASAEAARQALDLARKAEDKDGQHKSSSYVAYSAYLQGSSSRAGEVFEEARKLKQEIESNIKYLYSVNGIYYADYLCSTGDLDYARRVTEANLQICERNHWADDISRCYRVLGDLDFDSGNHESARAHYESALKIARSISARDVLIEALLARGRFFAKVAVGAGRRPELVEGSPRPLTSSHPVKGSGDPTPTINDAFNDLNEALNYAVEGGYRIFEADIRVALGWAYLANGEKEKAQESAQRALQMSQEMGYHWGKVDAEEVLGKLAQNT